MAIPSGHSDTVRSVDELISSVLCGRTECYREIIRRYQHDVLQVVGMLLYDQGATEDLVQDVFFKAYTALPRFRRGEDFRPWIRAIARSAVREELRRRSRYATRLKTYAEMLAARLAEDSSAARHEEMFRESLRRCLARLPERQAAAIRLRYHDGKSIDEVAAMLGITGPGVRNLLCDARKRLRECIEKEVNRP